jgi:hypothetical protein
MTLPIDDDDSQYRDEVLDKIVFQLYPYAIWAIVIKDGDVCKPLVFSFKEDPMDLIIVIRNSREDIKEKLSLLRNSKIERAP